MAASRSSLYSQFITPVSVNVPSGLPSWMFGANYGDIERNVLQTEQARANVEGTQALNDARDMQNQQMEKDLAFQQKMQDSYQKQKPTTLRDLYSMKADAASAGGRVEDLLDAQSKLDALDRQQKIEKINAITSVPGLMRAGGTEAAKQLMTLSGIDPSSMDLAKMEDATRKMQSFGALGRGYYEDGQPVIIPGTAKPAGGSGKGAIPKAYIDPASGNVQYVDPRDIQGRQDLLEKGYVPGEQKPKPNPAEALMSLFSNPNGAAASDIPVAPSARPVAALTPPPGVQVQKIIKNRSVK